MRAASRVCWARPYEQDDRALIVADVRTFWPDLLDFSHVDFVRFARLGDGRIALQAVLWVGPFLADDLRALEVD